MAHTMTFYKSNTSLAMTRGSIFVAATRAGAASYCHKKITHKRYFLARHELRTEYE